MTEKMNRIVYRVGNPENDEHHFTDNKDHADIARKNGYEVSEYTLAGMEQEPMAVAGFDAATAIRACMDEFLESVHDIVEECAQIAENTISSRHAAPIVSEGDEILNDICDLFKIGERARTRSAIMTNIENAIDFAEKLNAIEREFFRVPGVS